MIGVFAQVGGRCLTGKQPKEKGRGKGADRVHSHTMTSLEHLTTFLSDDQNQFITLTRPERYLDIVLNIKLKLNPIDAFKILHAAMSQRYHGLDPRRDDAFTMNPGPPEGHQVKR
jgi:hypothetical protein